MTAKQAPLKVERVPIDSVTPHPENKRRHTVERIETSLSAHGQFKPIVVQASTRHVIAGNGTWQAAKNIDWTEIDVHFRDVDDEQAMEILLVDNKAGDDSGYDDRGLAEVLAGMQSLERTGWTDDEAQELARVTGLLADQGTQFLDGFDGVDPETARRQAHQREYHQLSWPVTAEQRDVVLRALRLQRESMPERPGGERPTTIEALVALCQAHVDRAERKAAMRGDQ